MRKTTLLMCLVLLSALSPFFVQLAYAEDENPINLLQIPQGLADKFGISVFAGGLLATSILILIWVVPTAMLIRGKHATLVVLTEIISLFSFSIAIGWIPAWLLIILVFLVALLFGKRWGDLIG